MKKKLPILLLFFLIYYISPGQTLMDIADHEWILWRMQGEENPDFSEITLTFSSQDEKVNGSCYCNVYHSFFEYYGNNSLVVAPIVMTRRICGDKTIEEKFTTAIQSMDNFRFYNGNLHLLQGERVVLKLYASETGEPYPEEPDIVIPEPEPEPEPEVYVFDKYMYDHDNFGNRILRKAIYLRVSKSLTKNGNKPEEMDAYLQDTSFFEQPVISRLKDYKLKIYPNPTKGRIKIDIIGDLKLETSHVELFNITGKSIYSDRTPQMTYELDLSGHPNGFYLLRMILNGKSYEWKIIKE